MRAEAGAMHWIACKCPRVGQVIRPGPEGGRQAVYLPPWAGGTMPVTVGHASEQCMITARRVNAAARGGCTLLTYPKLFFNLGYAWDIISNNMQRPLSLTPTPPHFPVALSRRCARRYDPPSNPVFSTLLVSDRENLNPET
jgi:hypothetical protein